MSFQHKLNQIESLQQTIQKHGKLADDVLKKINYKFRLEWNYHSNKMEGGSLTKQETRSVMVGNITVNGKPLKDVMDMKGHDDVITSILKMGKGELNISEKRIKDIHAVIIYEEDPEKKKQIGRWKTEINYLYNYKNERVDFVHPDEVSEHMHSLVNWVNQQKEKIARKDKNALHPVQLAFQFHLDYVVIHPFYDGNGRTARILTNLILIAYGYPPVYIKTEEKGIYYQYLADIQGYGGAPDLFFDFMAGLLLRSQQIVVDTIDGKSIDESDDLDKKLYLLKQEFPPEALEEGTPGYNVVTVLFKTMVFKTWLSELLKETIAVIQKFNEFFIAVRHEIDVDDIKVSFTNEKPSVVVKLIDDRLNRDVVLSTASVNIMLTADYISFNRGGVKAFDCKYTMKVSFQNMKYEFRVPVFGKGKNTYAVLLEKSIAEIPTSNEIKKATQALGDAIFDHIDYYTKH